MKSHKLPPLATAPVPPDPVVVCGPAFREVSVMAWIEDPFGKVLLVRQANLKRLWTFPGGKARRGETLLAALKREVKEEIGLIVDVASLIDYYDRPEKPNVTFLFRVILKGSSTAARAPKTDVESYSFRSSIPKDSTPSLKFFWTRAQHSFEPLSIL